MIFAKGYFFFSIVICSISILLMGGWSFVGTAEQELTVGVPFLIVYAVTLIATFPVYRVRSQWKAIFEVSATRKNGSVFIVAINRKLRDIRGCRLAWSLDLRPHIQLSCTATCGKRFMAQRCLPGNSLGV